MPAAASPAAPPAVLWGAVASAWEWACGYPGIAALAAVAALLVYVDLRYRLPLISLPGPKTHTRWPVIGSLCAMLRSIADGNVPQMIVRNSELNDFKTWGDFCPGISQITISCPKNMRHMFSTHFSHYELSRIRTEVFEEALGAGIFSSDGARWKEMRAYASHLFSAAQLRQRMHEVFASHARKIRAVLEAAAPGEVVDMQRLMFRYTFDAICEIAFGYPVDSLGGVPADVEFQRCFDAVQGRCARRALDLAWKAKRALGVGEERTFASDLAVVNGYVARILAARSAGELATSSSDLLSIYEEHCASQGYQPTRRDLRDLVMNFMIAGRDTTACLLTWAWWELSRHPDVRARVEEDIQQNSDPAAMEYTQAVLQEVLRLHPSVPIDGKECVRPDVLPDGTRVRKGVQVGFHPCAITRNPELYPDPDEFRPARWLDPDGRCRKYDEYSYPVFNAGPRICLGRHMSPLEAKVLLAELMETLRIDVVPGFEPRLFFTAVMMTRNGMPCTVSPRGPDAGAAT